MVWTLRRPQLLPKLLDHYATGSIPSLRRIVLMWHDNMTKPDETLLNSFTQYTVPIVLEHRVRSLNERFRRSASIDTACVLSIDDDRLYSHEDIEMGFEAWKEYGGGRKRMVGYYPREISEDKHYLWAGFTSYR